MKILWQGKPSVDKYERLGGLCTKQQNLECYNLKMDRNVTGYSQMMVRTRFVKFWVIENESGSGGTHL